MKLMVPKRPEKRLCSIEGCGRRHDSRGLCGTHYARLKRFGDPQAEIPVTHKFRKLNFDKARQIRKAHAAGATIGSLARKYGVWRNAIKFILQGKTYKE